MKTNVPVGVTSWFGWLAGLAALVPTIVKDIEEGQAALLVGGPEKWSAITGIVLLAITQIGRYFQASIKAKLGQPH